MTFRHRKTPLVIALLTMCSTAGAVRINADGHGQALIYPYYTARSSPSGNAFVTALAVTNGTEMAKALHLRFHEGRGGAEVLDFNLFLGPYDTWTAGVVGAGTGAGIFTMDHSCTAPRVASDPTTPILFRNGAYSGVDGLGDTLDRTYEGYFEILEMGTIDPASALAASVTGKQDISSPNASKPPCTNLPVSVTAPTSLIPPTGGLSGNVSFINVNEGTDINVNALALSRWSDKVQWGQPGDRYPAIVDASPPVSSVVDNGETTDRMIVTQWTTGRDAVSAVLMVDRVRNDFTVETPIKAATDWVLTMPTWRHHLSVFGLAAPFTQSAGPFAFPQPLEQMAGTFVDGVPPPGHYFDREGQDGNSPFVVSIPIQKLAVFASVSGVWQWTPNRGNAPVSFALVSRPVFVDAVIPGFQNGFAQLEIPTDGALHRMTAPAGATTVIDTRTGAVRTGVNATYFGLPVIGFAAQTYSTTGLPGISPTVLSNYGGAFVHKFTRRIEISP